MIYKGFKITKGLFDDYEFIHNEEKISCASLRVAKVEIDSILNECEADNLSESQKVKIINEAVALWFSDDDSDKANKRFADLWVKMTKNNLKDRFFEACSSYAE